MFENVTTLLDKAIALNETIAWKLSIDNGVQKRIVELNTIDQMYNKGIDALGDSLGDYSQVSVEVYGKRAGHIQLKDGGEFYDSFVVLVLDDSFIIRANTIKNDSIKGDVDLTTRFGDDIIGLTEENRDIITELIMKNIVKYVKQQLNV